MSSFSELSSRQSRHRRQSVGAVVAAVLALALVLTGCTSNPSPVTSSSTPAPTPPAAPVGVQLFQWTWTSIAAECPTLKQTGYDFVQTSPPQESIVGEPWWIVYQPVSYQLESTLGTRAEFAAMVKACTDAGVEVYVDAVINHMTGQDDGGVGTAGTKFGHYDYPGLYTAADFHHCGLTEGDEIVDYSNQQQVQTCELVNLADLDTSSAKVRQTLATYLADLMSLGVVGFRIDAAKHIAAEDLTAIIELLPQRPKLILEVIRGGDEEPVQPEDYVGVPAEGGVRIQEFGFARALRDIFVNYSFSSVNDFNTASWLPSANAVSFVDNHDTERNGETVSIADPKAYRYAEAFLLGYGYGTPVIFSGYTFDGISDTGPPRDADGMVSEVRCAPPTAPFTCNHRDPVVSSMIAFHRHVGSGDVTVKAEGNVVMIEHQAGLVIINAGDQAAELPWKPAHLGELCSAATPDCSSKVTVTDGVPTEPIPAGGIYTSTWGA